MTIKDIHQAPPLSLPGLDQRIENKTRNSKWEEQE
jgi:hypothetical protein